MKIIWFVYFSHKLIILLALGQSSFSWCYNDGIHFCNEFYTPYRCYIQYGKQRRITIMVRLFLLPFLMMIKSFSFNNYVMNYLFYNTIIINYYKKNLLTLFHKNLLYMTIIIIIIFLFELLMKITTNLTKIHENSWKIIKNSVNLRKI